jgi:mRNA deadenylase 3'-5' endonuclease subunit Ccr4
MKLKIVTYNMLAHVNLTDHMEKGNASYCEVPELLKDWEFRREFFKDLFERWNADVYLLQEVERVTFRSDFEEFFDSKGYAIVLQETKKAIKSEHPVCVATVYRKSILEHVESDPRSRTLVSAFKLLNVEEKAAETTKTVPIVYIVNVHLEARWTNEEKRLSQLISSFQSLDKLYEKLELKKKKKEGSGKKKVKKSNKDKKGQSQSGSSSEDSTPVLQPMDLQSENKQAPEPSSEAVERVVEAIPEENAVEEVETTPPKRRIIIGGDFNSLPDQTVFQLLQSGELNAEDSPTKSDVKTPCILQVCMLERERHSKAFHPSLFLGKRNRSRIDFVWYSNETIHQAEKDEYELNNDELKFLTSNFLPNERYPSDHIALQYSLIITS